MVGISEINLQGVLVDIDTIMNHAECDKEGIECV